MKSRHLQISDYFERKFLSSAAFIKKNSRPIWAPSRPISNFGLILGRDRNCAQWNRDIYSSQTIFLCPPLQNVPACLPSWCANTANSVIQAKLGMPQEHPNQRQENLCLESWRDNPISKQVQSSRYFFGSKVLCALFWNLHFSPPPLWSANFNTKHAQNLWPNKYLYPCPPYRVLRF